MGAAGSLIFKIATEESEFSQIHRLNYKTFVEEIPQHAPNPSGTLVDPFHNQNTYSICLDGPTLVGMIALRGTRPFSLDRKLPDLDTYLPAGRSVCEVRLLSVERRYRTGVVFRGLVDLLARHGRQLGYDLAVISGTVRQEKLYRHLGFVPFGPLVGTGEARYQPMYLTLEAFEERARAFRTSPPPGDGLEEPASFLPGPAAVPREVRQALQERPVSHRSVDFMREFQQTRRQLCDVLGCRYAEILMGSGTLANDAVAAQLSLEPGRGMILTNGEFGNRLVDHATRFGLSFDVLAADWGEAFDRKELERGLDRGGVRWLWAVHCETSTGLLNDAAMLEEVCAARGLRLCLDCVSSMGTVPLDLGAVWLASGVSGKGLGAYPGLAIVCHNHEIAPASTALPRYLDLGLYVACDGVPFTASSNLLAGLWAALIRLRSTPPYDDLRQVSAWLRGRLRELGLRVVAPDRHAAPAVVTIALPPRIPSEAVGRRLEEAGYLLGYRSGYLLARNWIQIGLMGEYPKERLAALLHLLAELCATSPPLRSPAGPSAGKAAPGTATDP